MKVLGLAATLLALHRLNMADKEEKSLLPTSLSVKRENVKKRKFSIKRAFRWLHVLTTGLLVCWFSLLTLKSWRSDAKTMLPEEVIRQLLMNNEEVRQLKFSLLETLIHDPCHGVSCKQYSIHMCANKE